MQEKKVQGVQESTPQYQIKKIQTDFPSVQIQDSKHASDFIRQFYSDDIEIFESFFVLCLNNQCKTIGFAKIAQGGITSTIVDIRIIAKYAVDSMAVGVILAHNHPSGNLVPSHADVNLTEKVKNGLNLLDICVLDSLVITKDGFKSIMN